MISWLTFCRTFGLTILLSGLLIIGLRFSNSIGPPVASPATETPATASPSFSPLDQWQLTWSDEFDGEKIDPKKWDFDIGNGFFNYSSNQWIPGWGNEELQYYTNSPENAFVRDGLLHIRALKESIHRCGFTSARIKSRRRDGSALFNQKYGRFEFRAKLPVGKGVWPALWMLPQKESYGPWPSSGEIDVVEAKGQEPGKIHGTIHFGSRWPANTFSGNEFRLPENGNIDSFHVYAVEWEPGAIHWYVDGQRFATKSFWWSSDKVVNNQGAQPVDESELQAWPAPFDQPFYIVMNLAIGGRFAGNPDQSTPYPAVMQVDYVRVYEKAGGYGPLKARGDGQLPFETKR